MSNKPLNWEAVDKIIETALQEDIGSGDVTSTAIFSATDKARAFIRVKQPGIVAGLPVAERVFRRLDRDLVWEVKIAEGRVVSGEQIIAEMHGATRAILTGERLALNILQRLSGIATLTGKFVQAAAGRAVKILDTRKTSPGLRVLEKYAVTCGGGQNHRFGLYDAVMIKDNHIKLAGGIAEAVRRVRAAGRTDLSIELETSTLEEVREALHAGADIIMLDNMTPEIMRQAVEIIGGRAKVEASGGVTLERVAEIAATGVDYISVGALTHSAPALDIGLYFY